MLFGDFNAKHSSWNCSVNNKAGNELFSMQQSSNFLIHHTAEPTHIPHSGQTPSTIDILLTNVNFSFEYNNYFDQMTPDHMPTIRCTNVHYHQSSNIRFDFSRANWRSFRRRVENSINALQIPTNKTQIDSAIESFTNILIEAQNACIPTHSFDNKPQISVFTKQLILFKNSLVRRMQRSSDVNSNRELKTTINKLQKKITELVADDHSEFWDKKLSKIPKGGKKLWKLAKEFKGKADSNANKIKITGLKRLAILTEQIVWLIFLKRRTKLPHHSLMPMMALFVSQSMHSIPFQT